MIEKLTDSWNMEWRGLRFYRRTKSSSCLLLKNDSIVLIVLELGIFLRSILGNIF